MIAYPKIPLPTQSIAGDAVIPVVRTDLSSGLVEQESRFSGILNTFNLSWKMTVDEFVIFEEWFSEDLKGGVLTFALDFDFDGVDGDKPFRFVNGSYSATRDGGGNYDVTAVAEILRIGAAPVNRTVPVPSWYRVRLDPVIDQALTLAHRNSLLVSRPDSGSIRTLRIYPPTDPTAYIYFGIDNQGDGDTLITSVDVDPLPVLPTPSWPGTLPEVNIGFQDAGARAVSRLEMDGGHPRQWVEFDTTQKTYQATWDFTRAQMQTFESFFYATLRGGSAVFNHVLPVDGLFLSVPVRFVKATYSQSYRTDGTFRVSATLERSVNQTETPPAWRPYGLYYGPTVNVTANRKIQDADAFKFFICNPAAGQTINLHIYFQLIEFGVLNKGLGNVLITRGPFVVDAGHLSDNGSRAFGQPTFDLRDTIKPLGSIGTDNGSRAFGQPTFDLKVVLVPLDAVSDNGSRTFRQPTFTLDIP